MDIQQRTPTTPVDKYVEHFFHVRGYDPEHRVERIVPDGRCNIVIELDGQRRAVVDNETHEPQQICTGAWVSGPHRDYFSITALPNSCLIAIRFLPGGLFSFLDRPVDEIAGQVIPGEELLDGALLHLRKELLQQQTAEARLAMVDRWLLARLDETRQPPPTIQQAIQAILTQPTAGKLQDLVDASGYSRKQFNHLFKKHVGLSPKIFQRILRFGQILERVQQIQPISWATLSVECGYTDQSHFIKDFQGFSGFNPAEFLSTDPDRLNFFPMDGDPDLGESA